MGLAGKNVMVAVVDTGVDASHPDLTGRVLAGSANSLIDPSGHGTHVAGVIAGSGSESATVIGAPGSLLPARQGQFRGKAPAATVLSITGVGDAYLLQTAAQQGAFISNNSWTYGTSGYDLAAATYDAAVRDALPAAPGSQPLLLVFAAGNAGGGSDDGTGGIPDTIQSPATAKNVITVGAVEQFRNLTNSVTLALTNGSGGVSWYTNQPWLQMTASSNRVVGFSSRGNAGVGVEGEFGRFKPDLVAPGTFVVSTCSGSWDRSAYYSATNQGLIYSSLGNSLAVLSNLNQTLCPPPAYYRYESGTSLAAADVSGTLALMVEFFQTRLGLAGSPALFKALLINGARPLIDDYGFSVNQTTNSQGWGFLQLPTSLPPMLTNLTLNPVSSSIWWFDQDPAQALATGQSRTRLVSVAPAAQNLPLRATLVWTDPPGNPAAGVKLVNDLDLIVTNLETGQVFYGNDIAPGSFTNKAWDGISAPNRDVVNNVENVYLAGGLAANYSVTVAAHGVNVNAVPSQGNAAAQDYSLVLSAGSGELASALTVTDAPLNTAPLALVTFLTNSLIEDPVNSGAILFQERAGASVPDWDSNTIPLAMGAAMLTVGSTNSWHFYVIDNQAGLTNAAFITFRTTSISLFPPNAADGCAPGGGADLDLFVSQQAGLTDLDPAVLSQADMSANRGGAQTIVYTNASAGVYYVGVKCESQGAAEYAFAGVFSNDPFSQMDEDGNSLLRGFPAPLPIPDATDGLAGTAYLLAIGNDPNLLHRAVVSSTVSHQRMSDLAGTLTHLDSRVVLNNHPAVGAVANRTFIYDDSAEADIDGSQPSAGPGSLLNFMGETEAGPWVFSQVDTVPGFSGTQESLSLFLEPQPDLTTGVSVEIDSGACRQDFIPVPVATTNLTAQVSILSGSGPISMEICPQGGGGAACSTGWVTTNSSGVLVLDKSHYPLINPGPYFLRLCNQGPDDIEASVSVTPTPDPNGPQFATYTSASATPIQDNALTVASLWVGDNAPIVSAQVGVCINHPRVSDLVLDLVSPEGTRVLLDENRGGSSSGGMGLSVVVTNVAPVSVSTTNNGSAASTNIWDTGQTSGTVIIDYDFYSEPDDMTVYYEGIPIYDSGPVTASGEAVVNYGPGTNGTLVIVMNQGSTSHTNDGWFYTAAASSVQFAYLAFTEDTNLAQVPIKLAPTPFTNAPPAGAGNPLPGNIFVLPEQSLGKLAGQSALGEWKLEIWDTRAGAQSITRFVRRLRARLH